MAETTGVETPVEGADSTTSSATTSAETTPPSRRPSRSDGPAREIVTAPGRRAPAAARRPSRGSASCPGTGKWTVNGRTLDDVLPEQGPPAARQRAVRDARASRAGSTSSPASTAAASPARPARCAWPSPARSTRSTPRATARRSRRPASSPVTRGPRSARSTASRRPARLRSTASADRTVGRPTWARHLRHRRAYVGVAEPRPRRAPSSRWTCPSRLPRARRAGGVRRAPPDAVVGRDPRASGEFLEAAVVAAWPAPASTSRLGVLPTPAVAYLTAALGADLGVMISASHNPMPDNGIKFFARGGHKLADERRGRDRGSACARRGTRPTGAAVGRVRRDVRRPASATSQHLLSTRCRTGSTGSRSSSTARTAPPTAWRPRRCAAAGAEVIAIGAEPDGLNINDGCGSTHLDPLQRAVLEHGADVGIAHRRRRRPLPGRRRRRARWSTATRSWPCSPWRCARPARCVDDTVVATVMSNLGFKHRHGARGHRRRRDRGRRPLRPGGDAGRRLLARRRAVRPRDHARPRHHRRRRADRPAPAGPGRRRRQAARRAGGGDGPAAAGAVNVRGVDKRGSAPARRCSAAVAERPRPSSARPAGCCCARSGTEPMVRVMVEAPTHDDARAAAERLADVVRAELSLAP